MTYDAFPRSGEVTRRSLSLGGWFRILFTDRRILASWLIFLACGALFAYLVFRVAHGEGSAPPAEAVLLQSAIIGYIGWSLYWGVPGCLVLLRRMWGKVFMFFGFTPVGCGSIGLFLGLAFIVLVYYPPLGGGVFHFLRRWWFSGKQSQLGNAPAPVSSPLVLTPPVMHATSPVAAAPTPPPPTAEPLSDIEQRLRALAQLHERGLISRDEHDRQRLAILDKI